MALRIGLKPALPLIPLLPGLSLLGVLGVLLRDGHGGGLSVLQQFAAGAVQPSIDPIVLGSLLNGLQNPIKPVYQIRPMQADQTAR